MFGRFKLHSKNKGIIEVSFEDLIKVGRGKEVGHSFGVVTDIPSKISYEVFQAACGEGKCNCAITLKEVDNA